MVADLFHYGHVNFLIDLVIHGDDFSTELEKLCYKTPIEMGIYQTVGYTLGISTTELITRITAAERDWTRA